MFTKGDMVYADAYKYLRHKNKNIIALSFKGSADEFEEVEMTLPVEVKKEGNMLFWEGRKFAVIPEKMEYASIKERIIKSRYSNDDQIAIMLNRERSEEDNVLYQKMQEWREFAAEIAKKVQSLNR
ncbi:MAG TPA: hypothetical protein K8V07_15400 [Bacteroides xylanisolvens]|uniref:Uncharacterized protein n=1 Tax=Bacteroides xylanisolvens TaxID=371601 RepID=A0A921LHY0_9BACE|nr:hypothetical protein [Bacteroides xylanisolvens]